MWNPRSELSAALCCFVLKEDDVHKISSDIFSKFNVLSEMCERINCLSDFLSLQEPSKAPLLASISPSEIQTA